MSIEARAAAAKRLMDDPLLVEVLDKIRQTSIQMWERTAIDKLHEREVAWLTVKIANRIEAELQSMADDGLFAANRLQAPIR